MPLAQSWRGFDGGDTRGDKEATEATKLNVSSMYVINAM